MLPYYEIGKFRGHTLWMWDGDIPDDDMNEDMYVDQFDYSVWYKGRQVGYMKSDKSCIEPFNERVYKDLKNLKTFTPPKKKEKPVEKKKKVASKKVEEAIPADDLVSLTLGSVQTFGDEVFAELQNNLEQMMKGVEEWI